MSKRDGGPAFPQKETQNTHGGGFKGVVQHPGMSLRDWLAGQALAGMLSGGIATSPGTEPGKITVHYSEAARGAYGIADAMLDKRERGS